MHFCVQIETGRNHSTLIISECFPEDTGVFTCQAENPQGMVQCKGKLEVKRKYRPFSALIVRCHSDRFGYALFRIHP